MSDWYLGDNWDEETQKMFEQKLKKVRGAFNKAQYLRIKGSSLIKSMNSEKKQAGSKLLKRVISEYPNEISNVMFAYEQLGDYYFNEKNYLEAESNYRQSISFYRSKGRGGTSGIGDIKLAETIVKMERVDMFPEMYHLLVEEFKINGGSLSMNDDIFRYYFVLAVISNRLLKKEEAKEYASRALQLSDITSPQLDKYPTLGLVKVSEYQKTVLKDILIN